MPILTHRVNDTGYTFTRKALTGADVLKFSDALTDGGLTVAIRTPPRQVQLR